MLMDVQTQSRDVEGTSKLSVEMQICLDGQPAVPAKDSMWLLRDCAC